MILGVNPADTATFVRLGLGQLIISTAESHGDDYDDYDYGYDDNGNDSDNDDDNWEEKTVRIY